LALHDGCIELGAGTVHALCGGNGAGKSTFLNILMGLEAPDSGRIWLNGSETRFASPASALAAGIAIITQELSPVPDMTVAENIFLGRESRRAGWFVNQTVMRRKAAELLERLNFAVDPRAKIRWLSLAEIQLVAIANGVDARSRVLFRAAPTSWIGEIENADLFDGIRQFNRTAVAFSPIADVGSSMMRTELRWRERN